MAGEENQVSLTLTRKVAGVLGYFKNVPTQVGEETVTNLKLTVSQYNADIYMTTDTGSNTIDTPYDLIDMDLTGQTTTVDGLYVGNDLSAEDVVKLDNSQLTGKFLLPVKGVTMTLGLYNASGMPLKTWKVLCEAEEEFDLIANNLYSLGQKVRTDDTDGTPPGEAPEPGSEDEAIDLQLTDDILITINPDWSVFHYLTIE